MQHILRKNVSLRFSIVRITHYSCVETSGVLQYCFQLDSYM
jgi:hypothetical protein